jgi:chromosome partitioning protein
MVKKFDYCIIPTTLNPLGINRNSDVIKRTFEQVREHNKKAELFVLINSYQSDQTLLGRNRQLNHLLQEDLAPFLKRDQKAFYIDPIEEFAIRYSTTLLYWGYEAVVEGLDPQLSFQAFGGRSYPRDDFMRLAEYLEAHTHIDALKKGNT